MMYSKHDSKQVYEELGDKELGSKKLGGIKFVTHNKIVLLSRNDIVNKIGYQQQNRMRDQQRNKKNTSHF